MEEEGLDGGPILRGGERVVTRARAKSPGMRRVEEVMNGVQQGVFAEWRAQADELAFAEC